MSADWLDVGPSLGTPPPPKQPNAPPAPIILDTTHQHDEGNPLLGVLIAALIAALCLAAIYFAMRRRQRTRRGRRNQDLLSSGRSELAPDDDEEAYWSHSKLDGPDGRADGGEGEGGEKGHETRSAARRLMDRVANRLWPRRGPHAHLLEEPRADRLQQLGAPGQDWSGFEGGVGYRRASGDGGGGFVTGAERARMRQEEEERRRAFDEEEQAAWAAARAARLRPRAVQEGVAVRTAPHDCDDLQCRGEAAGGGGAE